MLWRQISNGAGQHISTSKVEYYSVIQGSLTGLCYRDEIVCPLIQRALQAMGPGATLCRTTMPLLTELGFCVEYLQNINRHPNMTVLLSPVY